MSISNKNFIQQMFTDLINENKDYLEYIKNESGEDFQEIKEEFENNIQMISKLKEIVKTEKDIYELEDDDVDFFYECIATYESIFIMDYTDTKKLKEQKKHYEKIQELLDIFTFDDDEEEDSEE